MTEFYEIFTSDRQPTGKIRPRYEWSEEGEYRLGAEIWLFHPDGRIMVTLRSPEKPDYPGKWECTGGFVCAGETTKDTILREVAEEIGLTLSPGDVRLVATELTNRQFIDFYTATVDAEIADLTLQREEVSGAKWANWDELAAMRDAGEFIDFIYDRILRNRERIAI